MKKSVGLWLAFSAASFVLLTGFHGGCGRTDTPESRARMINRMATAKVEDFLDDLDATDPQRRRVHEIKDELIKQGMPLIDAQKRAKEELKVEWAAETPNVGRVHAIIDDRIDGIRAFIHKIADGAIEVHQLLTPKQRAEITGMCHGDD
jgi:Spy/CpxP family protein refolding chaperone